MATIHVFNNQTGNLERYVREANEPMPYNRGGTLTAGEFLVGTTSSEAWTTTDTMEAFNKLRALFNEPITINLAFTDLEDNCFDMQFQHFFGTAFLLSPANSSTPITKLYTAALDCDAFSVIFQPAITDEYIHVDVRYRPADYFITNGNVNLFRGTKAPDVFVVQRFLNKNGFGPLEVDGIFGPITEAAVSTMQQAYFIAQDGTISNVEREVILGISQPRSLATILS